MQETVTPAQLDNDQAGLDVGVEGQARPRQDHGPSIVAGVLFWGVVIGIVALTSDTARDFLAGWRWAAVAVAAVVAVTFLVAPVRRRLQAQTSTTRAALVIFVVVPLLLAGVGSVTVLSQAYQLVVLRVVFLLVVCLLPAAMWYLFIATRKASLLNEFLTNLHRLGLLGRVGDEDETAKNRRIHSYLQRFEAIYGDLPSTVQQGVTRGWSVSYTRSDASGSAALSTTTVPVILSTVLIALGWLVTLPPGETIPVDGPDPWAVAFVPTGSPVTLAFLGAYFFSLQMLFRRYVLKDLHDSAYVAVTMRIILAVIAIWVLMSVSDTVLPLSDEQLLVAGFVLGVFPRVIWQVIASIFKRITRVTLPSMRSDLPLGDLDGLTVWHEARLEEEDVENVPNMASADLVELLLSTRLAAEQIIDWVDQAILYTQLGPQPKDHDLRWQLRVHGIRTATSLLVASAEAREGTERAEFEKIFQSERGVSILPTLEAALTTNSNLELIRRWRRRPARHAGRGLLLDGAPRPSQS